MVLYRLLSVLKMAISGLLLLGCCLMWQGIQAQLVYKLVRVDCIGNPARVNNTICNLKAINWNLALLNMETVLIVPIRKPIIHLKLLKKDYSNQYKPFLVDVSLNMCEIIEKRSYIPYGVIIWKLVKQFTNANHSCPFSGHMIARNGYLNTTLIPPLPQGFYMFSFSFTDMNSTHSEYIGILKLYVEAKDQVNIKKRPKLG